jgi:phospholipid/cholesterol/gamma-HCH transport system permease protein
MAADAGSERLPVVARVSASERLRGGRAWERIESAAGMWHVAVRTLRVAFTSLAWVPPALSETATIFRRCVAPLLVCVSVFIAANGVFTLGKVIQALGAPDRQAGGIFTGSLREVATWVVMMVFAGVAGSATTSDLGARKIREELDAMAVLGVESIRALVVPRVMAFTFAAVVLGGFGLLAIMVTDYLLVPSFFHLPDAVFFDSVRQNINTADILSSVLKHVVIGFVVGVVCCTKGLRATGGAEGVGKAVNQAVVVSFFVVWMLNSIFNVAYLSLFPDASILRG